MIRLVYVKCFDCKRFENKEGDLFLGLEKEGNILKRYVRKK